MAAARSDCGADSATTRTFEIQALEALSDLAKKKRAKASKASPEKMQPLVPKLDLSLLQVCSSFDARIVLPSVLRVTRCIRSPPQPPRLQAVAPATGA
jgi:hypothetical protein